MAKIVEEIWNVEKFFWRLKFQVKKEQVKVICKSSSTDKTKLKVYFDLENKQKHSMYAIADCIETIRDSYMIASGCSTIEFEFNGKKIEVKNNYGAPSALKQMAKTVYF